MSIASDLTALCSAQTTLINDVLAQSILADIAASDIAVLGSFPSNSSQLTVQLAAGGDVILAVPVQDGLKFRLSVAGHTHNPSGSGSVLEILLIFNGSQINFTLNQNASPSNPNQPFYMDVLCVWDSASNKILMSGEMVQTADAVQPTSSHIVDSPSISSPSSLPFKINGSVSSSNSSATLTITEFRAYAA